MPLALALLATGSALPAFADTGSAPSPPDSPIDGGPIQTAQLQAVATGVSVPIPSLTTQTMTVEANPDGSLTQTQSLLPERVQQDGTWTDVDSTLTQNSDGTYSPAATPSGVVLSAGGTGPLATLTDPAGHTLSLTLPFSLPAPTVSGSTALYPAVLPGVDLSVSVTDQGAFSDVLIVHNAAAAANPQLKTLTFATSTQGLTLSTSAQGMTATAPDQSVSFTAPPAVEWDSSTTTDTTATSTPSPSAMPGTSATPTPDTSGPASASASASPSAPSVGAQIRKAALAPADTTTGTTPSASTDTASDGTATASSVAGPGSDAQVDPVTMSASAGTLALTPDPSLLTSPTTNWPIYIDPTLDPSPTTSNYFEPQEGCDSSGASSSEYDHPQTYGEGVGDQGSTGTGDCTGPEETYYEMNTSGLKSDMVVSAATFNLYETDAATYDCTHTAPLTLYKSNLLSPGMYWDTKPTATQVIGTPTAAVTSAYNGVYAADTTSCGTKPVEFTVTSQMQDTATNEYPTWTVALKGDESDPTDFMRFAPDPTLTITYDIAPTISSPNTEPPAVVTAANGTLTPVGPACNSGTPGWIGQTSTTASGYSNLSLDATAGSPIPGTHVAIYYSMLDNQVTVNGTPSQVTYGRTDYQAPGANPMPITTNLQDGHQYSWNAQASDGILSSAVTETKCRFDVDTTPPSPATITNPDFPEAGTNGTPTKYAGQPTTFTLSSTDQPVTNPSSCTTACLAPSGIAGFRYSLDEPIPTVGYSYVSATAGAGSSGSATVTLTPGTWGTHTLFVQAVDNAGNTESTPSSYPFYAPWNPATKVQPGDLDGDGIPDLLATTTDPTSGQLLLIPGNSDPASTATTASTAAETPDNSSWNNYIIAHRGSLSGGSVDDLFLFKKTAPTAMYLYVNNTATSGTAGHFTNTSQWTQLTKPSSCTSATGTTCPNYQTTWATTPLTQMVSPGDVYGDGSNAPDLITMEGNELYIYQHNAIANQKLGNVHLLGDGNWSNMTLIAPGTVNGTPTLWARDNTSGTLYSYPLTNPTTNVLNLLHAPTRGVLQSGVTDTANSKPMCADDPAASSAAGTIADIADCNGSYSQNWTLNADGTVHIHGLCLDVIGASSANDAPVDLYTCSTTPAQKWTEGPNGSLVNAIAGYCLEDPNGTSTPGTQLVVQICNAQPDQEWGNAFTNDTLPAPNAQTLLPLNLPSTTYPTIASPGDVNSPPTTLISGTTDAAGDSMCADDLNASTTPGNIADLTICNHTEAQSWSLNPDGTIQVNGLCLDVVGASSANDAPVDLYTCSTTPAQKWTEGPNGSLVNAIAGYCLEDPNGTSTPGTQLVVQICNAQPDQEWGNAFTNDTLPAPSGTGPDGNPDLYVIDTNGVMSEYPGATPTGTTATFAPAIVLGDLAQFGNYGQLK